MSSKSRRRGESESEARASPPRDKEIDESEIMHMTNRSQCETEDFHKCSPKESLVPRVTMDRGPFAHGVHMDPVLTQKIHSAVETCQVLHERSETVRSMVCWKTLSRVAWVKCCSSEMLGLPFGYSSTQQRSDEKRRRWQRSVRSICISRMAQVRML